MASVFAGSTTSFCSVASTQCVSRRRSVSHRRRGRGKVKSKVPRRRFKLRSRVAEALQSLLQKVTRGLSLQAALDAMGNTEDPEVQFLREGLRKATGSVPTGPVGERFDQCAQFISRAEKRFRRRSTGKVAGGFAQVWSANSQRDGFVSMCCVPNPRKWPHFHNLSAMLG